MNETMTEHQLLIRELEAELKNIQYSADKILEFNLKVRTSWEQYRMTMDLLNNRREVVQLRLERLASQPLEKEHPYR